MEKFILLPGVGRASLRVGRRRLRAPRWCAPFQREYGGDYRGRDCSSESDLPEYLSSYIVTPSLLLSGSLRRYFLILALVQRSDSESSGQRSKIFGPPTQGRVVRGLWGWRPLWQRPFSTYKSPKFYLSFTILVSLILVECPDKIGPVNTVPTVPTAPHAVPPRANAGGCSA